MVLRVCGGVLRDLADIEDAFQATFLVLARKARSIRKPEAVGSWLYGVALRIASNTKVAVMRRQVHERRCAAKLAASATEEGRHDLELALLREVDRLPEKYRAPIVLCYLEGLTHEAAARRLSWPVGTVEGRMARARRLLRSRLNRRGLAPAIGLLGASVRAGTVSAAVPAALAKATVAAALRFTAGRATAVAAGVAPAAVAALSEEALSTMLPTKLSLATVLAVACVVVTGAGGFARQATGSRRQDASVREAQRAYEGEKSIAQLRRELEQILERNDKAVTLTSRGKTGFSIELHLQHPQQLDDAQPIMEAMRKLGPIGVVEAWTMNKQPLSVPNGSLPIPPVGAMSSVRSQPPDNPDGPLRGVEQSLDRVTRALEDPERPADGPPIDQEVMGHVTFVDYQRREILVNITRRQGVRRQMEMSIFAAADVGSLTANPKGTIELTEVGEQFSTARIVKTNYIIDPIRVGDIAWAALPAKLTAHPGNERPAHDTASSEQERRLTEVERKLDQILKTVEGLKRQRGR
jgi:RNA polymerase sigma factor (sigma-70 family)